jgi:hypothetical protein
LLLMLCFSLRWVGKPRNTLMKLYDLLLLLQQQIHSKCEWAAAAAEKAAAAAAAAAAEEEAAAGSGAGDGQSTPSVANRKMSAGSAALQEGVKGAAASPAAAAGASSSASSSSTSSSTSTSSSNTSAAAAAAAVEAPSNEKASTEFEYVLDTGLEYTFEDGDEEIVGRNTHFKLRRAPTARFGTGYLLCHKETLFLMKARWDSLIAAFYDRETDAIDPTKLPDLYGQHTTDRSQRALMWRLCFQQLSVFIDCLSSWCRPVYALLLL